MKIRFLPWNSNPVTPNPPIMTGLNQPPLNSIRLKPAPFLITTDANYPAVAGAINDWAQLPEWWTAQGTGPQQRNVILCNVGPQSQGVGVPPLYPSLVYTALIVYPSQWDSLFDQAMVAYLGQQLALTLSKDKKLGLSIRGELIKTCKAAVIEARAQSANESGYPQSADHTPDWIRARNAGAGGYWGGGDAAGWGCGLYGGFDGLAFSDGSVF